MRKNIKKCIDSVVSNLFEESSIDLLDRNNGDLPFWVNHHPVNFVKWIPSEKIFANDYNPNKVAPPEMALLKVSIEYDGFTQPIVVWQTEEDKYEVIDGFHRHIIGKQLELSHLPCVVVNKDRLDRGDRIAATIRHNRARGKHQIGAMSDIVVELKRRNWSNEKISKNLGMDEDEILRLCQITGLSELFTDKEFSKAWDIEGEVIESDFRELNDNMSDYGDETKNFRAVNTKDENRIFHTYEKWECYKAGFYDTHRDGLTKKDCENKYREFLSDIKIFSDALEHIISEWKYSCEHYLTNSAMNRIAWLGQAAACYAINIPSVYRSGYYLLTKEQQKIADETALLYLNKWLKNNNREEVTMEEAISYDRQSDIY